MNAIATARTAAPAEALSRLLERGTALLARGKASDALPLLERASVLPGAPPQTHALLAEALLETGRAPDALRAAGAALAAIGPGDVDLHLLRARIQRALSHKMAALDEAAAAVMADPRHVEARRMLAEGLSEAGRHGDAISLVEELAAESPGDAQRQAWLGLALVRGGAYERGDALLAEVAGRTAGAWRVWAARAQAALQIGDAPKAEALARDALALRGPDAGLLATLGHALFAQQRRDEAGSAFAEAARLAPDDAYLAHIARALGAGPGAERAGDGYVRALFDDYADRFEESLIGLRYRVPGLVRLALDALVPGLREGSAQVPGDLLDLGCGTGLAGLTLRDAVGGRMVGVDLSARMVDAARRKEIYDELHVAEIGAYLAGEARRFNAVVAADVLCYFGPLAATIAACADRLAPGGLLVFTVERSGSGAAEWELASSGRYRHGEAHVRAALAAAGLATEILRPEDLRLEAGLPVEGLLAVARKLDA